MSIDLISVGNISAAHGIRGEVKIRSFTVPPNQIFLYQPWHLLEPSLQNDQSLQNTKDAPATLVGAEPPPMVIVTASPGSQKLKTLTARLPQTTDRNAAERWMGYQIFVAVSQFKSLEAGEYYWYQLIGLDVRTAQGLSLGHIDRIIETGANDVLIIKPNPQSPDARERLIPYTHECVLSVNLGTGVMVVDWDPDF